MTAPLAPLAAPGGRSVGSGAAERSPEPASSITAASLASISTTPAAAAAPASDTPPMSSTILSHSSAPRVLAFDIGGTWVKIGVVDAGGRLLHVDRLSTLGADGGQTLVARLLVAATPLVERYAPAGIAFSTLGVIDQRDGRLVAAVEAIAGYVGVSPKKSFEQALGLPVVVENDGNCVALAEGWTGAAAGIPHYLALTLGTGIGGGIVIDGRLYRGSSGAAGEIGYMPVGAGDPHDRAVRRRGMLEETAGAAAVSRIARERNVRPPTPARVFAAARRGDAAAIGVVDEEARRIALAIAAVLPVLDPELVILGGGIGGNGDLLLAPVEREVAQLSPFRPRIAVGELGDEAVLHGAVATALRAAQEQLFTRVPNRDRREIVV